LHALPSPISIAPILIELAVADAAEVAVDIICDIDVEDVLGIDMDMSILECNLMVIYSWQTTSR
jgi:hypothetical protein